MVYTCVYVCCHPSPSLLFIRWLVEDYATLSTLSRLPSPDAYLGVVNTKYTLQFSILNFSKPQ